MKTIIETDRLYLREMVPEDFNDLYLVLADSDNMSHYPYTFDEKRVRNWIDKNIKRYSVFGFGLWGIILKKNNFFIGDCGITMQNINDFIYPEIGYHIRKEFQGNGYAKEAGTVCKLWAFENTTFKEIFSYMKSDNKASYKTAESIGMEFRFEYKDTDGDLSKVYSARK